MLPYQNWKCPIFCTFPRANSWETSPKKSPQSVSATSGLLEIHARESDELPVLVMPDAMTGARGAERVMKKYQKTKINL
jgi:hypothetical protein